MGNKKAQLARLNVVDRGAPMTVFWESWVSAGAGQGAGRGQNERRGRGSSAGTRAEREENVGMWERGAGSGVGFHSCEGRGWRQLEEKELTRWPHLSVERREGGKRVADWASAHEEKGRRGEGLGRKGRKEKRRGGKDFSFYFSTHFRKHF